MAERKGLLGASETVIRGVGEVSVSSDRFELLKAPAHVASHHQSSEVPKYGPQPIEIRFGAAVWGADQAGRRWRRPLCHCRRRALAGRCSDLRGEGPLLQRLGPGTMFASLHAEVEFRRQRADLFPLTGCF
jgi:hypothetical protein